MSASESAPPRKRRRRKIAAKLRRAPPRPVTVHQAAGLAAALAQARETARALQVENQRIRQEVQARNVFLATLSHELRAPLNAVIGFADLLAAGVVPADSPRRTHYLGHIRDRGLQLLHLINDVLDLSRVEAGACVLAPERVDLRALIAGVVDVLHTRIARKRLVVLVDVPPGLPPVVLDAPRLKQALAGVLDHALQASPVAGHVEVRVRLQSGERFQLAVQDSGPAIAPERWPGVFEAFAEDSAGHRVEGTGLGLALARRLVQAQGGSVSVHGAPGRGSVLSMELPLVPAGYRMEDDAAHHADGSPALTSPTDDAEAPE